MIQNGDKSLGTPLILFWLQLRIAYSLYGFRDLIVLLTEPVSWRLWLCHEEAPPVVVVVGGRVHEAPQLAHDERVAEAEVRAAKLHVA